MSTPPQPDHHATNPQTAADLLGQAQWRSLIVEQIHLLMGVLDAAFSTLPARVAAADWGTTPLTQAVAALAEAAASGLDDVDVLTGVAEQLQRVQAAAEAAEQIGARVAELGAVGAAGAFPGEYRHRDEALPPTEDTEEMTMSVTPDPTSHARTLRDRGITLHPCYGCRVEPGQPHGDDCDHARCPDCGEQLIYHACDADDEGPDRPALWHGIDPRDEVAQAENWWTTAVGIDHLVEDSTRVLFAVVLDQVTWDPHSQRYVIGQIDNAALDRAIARSQ